MENKRKKGLISFSKLNKYFIIPLILPVVNAIHSFLFNYIFWKKNIPFKNKGFLLLNYDFMSMVLGNGIPFLISLCLQTKHKEKNDLSIKFKSDEASTEKINNNELKQKKAKLFFLIIIMALIYASTGIYFWFDNSDYFSLNIRFFLILFVFLWSKVILKTQIFRHHYFSLLICFIGFILSSIPIFKDFTKKDFLYFLFSLIYALIYSFFLSLIKYTPCYYFISPFLCLSYVGIFSYIIIYFSFSIYSLIKLHNFSYIADAFDFSVVKDKKFFYLCSLSSLIVFSIFQLLFTFIIYFFSPNLFMVSEILTQVLFTLVNDIVYGGDDIPNIIIKYIVFFMLCFATLVMNEIIILNFCGLNEFTYSSINERLSEEIRELEGGLCDSGRTSSVSLNYIDDQNGYITEIIN